MAPASQEPILKIAMIRILTTVFAALLGLAFGSFLNVCLSRWPEEESVVQPRSHCRSCNHTLAWWENVPLVSWLALRGRCRDCRAWIGWRYPLVEFAVAALWAVSAWQILDPSLNPDSLPVFYYGAVLRVAGSFILYWLLVALAVLDAENLWLPEWITLPGTALGFLFVVANAALATFSSMNDAFETGHPIIHAAVWSLTSILLAAGIVLLIRWVYWLIRRREGIGMGDAVLMALLAAWLGLPLALLAFVLGVVLGAVVAVTLLAIPSERAKAEGWALNKLPLGTFLCIGGIGSALWGQPILAAYLRWSGF